MKILLTAVNAKYIHSNPAVYDLQAYAARFGQRAELAEFTINQSGDEILRGIYLEHPDVLCFSCYIWNISFVRDLISDAAKILPGIEIWAGGPEVSYDAEQFLAENPAVRGVMMGEGEQTFLELMQFYNGENKSLDMIEGIVFRTDCGEVVSTGWREVLDLSEVPFPYSDLENFEHRIIYYESSRGCPFRCSYCLSSVDKRLRFRDLSLVKRELIFFLERRVAQVKFVDRTFNCRKEHSREIWRFLTEYDNGITNFHFEIAADLLEEEDFEIFSRMRPGLIQLEIGVQTTNPKTLREIHRNMDFSKVSAAVRAVRKNRNIHQHLDLIAGLPWEDYESFARSFGDVYALRPQQLQLGFLKVLKGSYMQEHTAEYGCLYRNREPYEVLSTAWLSYGDVLKLKAVEEMVEVYYNSGQFQAVLPEMERRYENPFFMFEKLGEFYEKKSHSNISRSRIRRYEILLEFLTQEEPERLEEYRQLLTYDAYARENLKSRPAFAPAEEHKQEIRSFYQWEEEHRRYLPDYADYDWKQMSKMTHMEYFTAPIPLISQTYEAEGGYFLLFDYRCRDPLTYNARCVVVPARLTEQGV